MFIVDPFFVSGEVSKLFSGGISVSWPLTFLKINYLGGYLWFIGTIFMHILDTRIECRDSHLILCTLLRMFWWSGQQTEQ